MPAGSVTITEVDVASVKKIIWAWTSDASGDVDVGLTTKIFDGKLVGLTTIPDGVAAPTDNYDIVINDADGHDVLVGAGANRDTLNTEHVTEGSLAAVAHSALDCVVSNAGNAKQGTVILYIR